MDLTTAGLIMGAVGFIIGSLLTTIIFLIVSGVKKGKLKKKNQLRHDIISSIGKKCAEIDHVYSEYRIGKMHFDSLGAMVLEKIEDVSGELYGNSDILDSYYIKHIERFIADQKNYLMNGVFNSQNQERAVQRPQPVEPEAEITQKENFVQEISAENTSEEEVFAVEAAEEFRIEEEPAFKPENSFTDDSALTEDAPARIDAGRSETDFDINATTVLSVDEIRGTTEKRPENISPVFEEVQEEAVFEVPPFEGETLFAGEEKNKASTFEQPVAESPKQEIVEQNHSDQTESFIDMNATQVFDQRMLQVPTQETEPQVQYPQKPQMSRQFEQPIPEPPVKRPAAPPSQQALNVSPPPPVRPQATTPPTRAGAQQNFSAFDVEATQEFHVNDIMQHAQQPRATSQTGEEEIFEINMPSAVPAQKKKDRHGDMVSGDDVANQMDNFFGFD